MAHLPFLDSLQVHTEFTPTTEISTTTEVYYEIDHYQVFTLHATAGI